MRERFIYVIWGLLIVCFAFNSCNSNKQQVLEDPLFQLLPSSQTGIDFNNKVTDTKEFNVFKFRNFYNGGGVAIGDVNNDNLPDIFFTANQEKNRLYINKGQWKFEDVTAKAGVEGIYKWHTGTTMVDINADGWLDIYVCNSGDINGDDRNNELYINQHDGTFKEEAKIYGLDDKGLSTHASFFDYDHDGDLDCYILNNSYRPIESFGYNRNLRHIRDAKGGDRLYRNDGFKYVDVSEEAGIYGSEIGFGLGITVGDVNNDGWDDIYISNDFFEKDYLYINQQNGKFKEVIDNSMGHLSMSSMGSDMIDINNDGWLDIFTTDMLPEDDYRLKTTTRFDEYDVYNAKLQNDFHHQFTANCLQLNNGDGTFSEIAQLSGVDATDWSWGALGFDFNNDGWKDLFVSNGISKDLTDQDFLDYFSSEELMKQVRSQGFNFKAILDKMPSTPVSSYGFINEKNLNFKNSREESGIGKIPAFSNGAAYGDLDVDGDLDLVVNNENMEAFVYRNMSSENLHTHYLKVKLEGSTLNVQGIGSRVTLFTKGMQQVLEQMPARGFESSVEPVLNFGIADNTLVDSLVIRWPDMKMQTLKNIPANSTITLKQSEANTKYHRVADVVNGMYENITTSIINGKLSHHENNFIDFDIERLIPKMLSTEGPKIAVGDVNNDGLQDFFMGSAAGDTSRLFIQQTEGNFIQQPVYVFSQDKDYEDAGAVFFDADKDGDSDLLVASGGNQEKIGSLNLLTRLYLNDGKGSFTRNFKGWPLISINASCVRVYDVDGDGNEDIFIGARSVPGNYGSIPSSILLLNDGQGNFISSTKTIAPSLMNLGMVTDAEWTDIDGDGKKELVVSGDWMAITILKYQDGKLQKTSEIPHSAGWWNCLTVTDIDDDGDVDLIGGNYGLNSRIRADSKKPGRLFVGDFDMNGQTESVPVYYKADGKAYPYYLKNDIVMQIPNLKKKFLRYDVYAGKPIEEIFSKDQLREASVLIAEQTQTCIFINDGKGHFTTQPLPLMAQLSPVFGILVSDLDGDGIKDIFLGGNFYGLKPEVGRMDASYGTTFIGNKQHQFRYVTHAKSGLFTRGEVRDIKNINTAKGNCIIVARNNDSLQIFQKTGRH